MTLPTPRKDPFWNPTGLKDRARHALVVGGAAGDLTLTGITEDDELVGVWSLTFTLTEGTPNVINTFAVANLTSEFSITAANTINNTGGTATTGRVLLVVYIDKDWGEQANASWI